MADDLSLLFRIRGDAAGAKQATAETRAAVASLRSQLGSDFNAMQSAGQSALANLGNSVNVFVGQRVPLLGGAFLRVTENLKGFGDQSHKNDVQLASLNKTIDGLSTATGKSRSQITSFLTQFVQIEGQAKRDALAIEKFGAATAQSLIPQLEKAGTEMATVAANSTATGGAFAALGGPVGIALLAVGALTVGVIALGKELISLTISTADWQGKLFDLSQQTGVSVETLSALQIVAEQTGSSIESVAASLGIFQRHLEEAQDPTSKAGKLFAQLNIDTLNTEDAFRQALRSLASMPEGFRQTAAALELFGRGGKSVLAILKEVGGDLDAATERFRKMGILLDTETSKSADEFNDTLKTVQRQMQATTALLVRDLTPQILSALQSVSKFVAENRTLFIQWGQTIGDVVRGAKVVAQSELGQLAFFLGRVSLEISGVLGLLRLLGTIGAATRPEAGNIADPRIFQGSLNKIDRFNSLADRAIANNAGATGGGGRGGGGGGGGRPAAEKVSAGQRLLNSLIDEHNNLIAKNNELTRVEIITQELLKKEYDGINIALRDRIIGQAGLIDIEKESAEADKRKLEIQKQLTAAAARATEASRRMNAERLDLEDRIAEAVQDQREALSELQGFEKSHLQTVQEYIIQAVKEAEAIGGVTAAMREYFALLIKIAAKRDEITANKKRFEGVEGGAEGIPGVGRSGGLLSGLESGQIDQLTDGVKNFQDAATVAFSAVGAAVGGLAQGIGSLVESWVLMGSESEVSVKKMVAAVLAGVAAQSAVLAIFELAKGFAALFLNPAEAAAHWKAAALFGSLAVISAAAGRLTAGNDFSRNRSTADGASQAATGGGSSRGNGSPLPITLGSQRGPSVQHLVVEIKTEHGFSGRIVSAVLKDANNNGQMREMIVKEIKRQE